MASETARELLDKALKRQAELQRELEALSSFIKTYQYLIVDRVPSTDDDLEQLTLWSKGLRKSLKSDQLALLLEEARRLILQEKVPLTRSDLVKRLEERGYSIVGKDKSKVLGTNIWRSQRFIHIDGQGYWPKDVPLPAGV